MYDMCRYSQAWTQNATCIWCIVCTENAIGIAAASKIVKYHN